MRGVFQILYLQVIERKDEGLLGETGKIFVEDLVRNVAADLNAHPAVKWYRVEAENFESIHNHNAYAMIEA